MNIRFLSLVLAGAFFVGCSADNIEQNQPQDKPTPAPETPKTWEDKSLPNATLISNGKVQIGVDLTRGGGIFISPRPELKGTFSTITIRDGSFSSPIMEIRTEVTGMVHHGDIIPSKEATGRRPPVELSRRK